MLQIFQVWFCLNFKLNDRKYDILIGQMRVRNILPISILHLNLHKEEKGKLFLVDFLFL